MAGSLGGRASGPRERALLNRLRGRDGWCECHGQFYAPIWRAVEDF